MPEFATCRILRTQDELHNLRPAWEQLWRSDPGTTPFQSPAWLLPWWGQFNEGSLRVAAVYRSESLRALLPFYLYTEPAEGGRKLFPLGVATSDYLDGIFARDCTTADILIGLDSLFAEDDWDSFEVTQLRPGSRFHSALQQSGFHGLLSGHAERVSRLDAVPLAQLPLKIRRNAMYYRNRAARKGTLELTIASNQNWLDAFEALERLHTARWNLTGDPGVLADPRVRAWHREAIPQLFAEDLVRLYCLRLNGEIIAALYILIDPPSRSARTQYIYLPAFSPEHADLRPGSLMLALATDQAAREGFATIDFLRGDESYKDLWHPRWMEMDMFLLLRAEAEQLAA